MEKKTEEFNEYMVVKIGGMNMFFGNQEQYDKYLEWKKEYNEHMIKEEAKLLWGIK